MSIKESIAHINQLKQEAAERTGRKGEDVLLVAVTKLHDPSEINEAIDCGITDIGENKVQEILNKYDAVKPVRWHLIGHLQTNKVKYIIDKVCMIHSVDSPELMHTINRLAEQRGLTQDILIEVNVGGEAAKSGIPPEAADEMAAKMAEYPNLRLRGFMTIPPISTENGGNLRYFAKMYELYVDIKAKKYDNTNIDCLSMGMSDDFADAIKEGTTMIRVGTRIFGARQYVKN